LLRLTYINQYNSFGDVVVLLLLRFPKFTINVNLWKHVIPEIAEKARRKTSGRFTESWISDPV